MERKNNQLSFLDQLTNDLGGKRSTGNLLSLKLLL